MSRTNLYSNSNRHAYNFSIVTALGPDRNSGSGPIRYRFRWNLGWFRPVPVDLAGTRPVPRFFSFRVFKVANRTVESSLKSGNVEFKVS